MFELMFLACTMLAEPSCSLYKANYTFETEQQCMVAAQPALAEWVNQHPKWELIRFGCLPVERGQDA